MPNQNENAGGKDRAGQIQSVTRALSVLNTLSEDDFGMTLTELANTVHLPPSTTHRLLTTLQQEKYVRFDQARGVWQIGVQCFSAGNAFLRTRDIVSMTRPYMRRLMEESGETTNLAVRDSDEMVYLAQVECREMMRAFAKPGARVPLAGSAVGKTVLANSQATEVDEIIRRTGLEKKTAKSIDSAEKMYNELDKVRALGFAVDDEEHAVGLRCVAAPIYDQHGETLAAISISGPTARISDSRLEFLGKLVINTARESTSAIGGRQH